VTKGQPIELRAVWEAADYWSPVDGEGSPWGEELRPRIRAFLEKHQDHELVYGEAENLGFAPMTDGDYGFLDWLDETEEDLLPRHFIERLGYRERVEVAKYILRMERPPWWWYDREDRYEAEQKFRRLTSFK
jgi:hypothetical protein